MIYEDAIDKVGLDVQKVESIANRISTAAREADGLGLKIFGGTGSGTLRFDDNPESVETELLIIAELDGICWDGGDGATREDSDGYLRGE